VKLDLREGGVYVFIKMRRNTHVSDKTKYVKGNLKQTVQPCHYVVNYLSIVTKKND